LVLLLERDAILYGLDVALAESAHSAGRLVLISGEAGIGKSALMAEFARRHRIVPAVWGASVTIHILLLMVGPASMPSVVRARIGGSPAVFASPPPIFHLTIWKLRGLPP
jgi:hypothetical protein